MVIFTKKFGTLDPHLPIVWDKVPKKRFFWTPSLTLYLCKALRGGTYKFVTLKSYTTPGSHQYDQNSPHLGFVEPSKKLHGQGEDNCAVLLR